MPDQVNSDETRLHARVELAQARRLSGDYGAARRLLTSALPAAQHQFGRDALLVARICNELGLLGKYTGRFAEAETHYRRALRIFEQKYGTRHDTVATVLHNLGGLAHARGDHQAGEPLARRGAELRTDLHGPDHPLVAADLAAWAALLDGCGRLAQAGACLRRALVIFEQTGDVHEIAVTTHNLAALHHRQGDLAAAIRGYTRALELKESLLGSLHPELAPTLVNLAAAHRSRGHAERAEALYRRVIELLRPVVDDRHPILLLALEASDGTGVGSGARLPPAH